MKVNTILVLLMILLVSEVFATTEDISDPLLSEDQVSRTVLLCESDCAKDIEKWLIEEVIQVEKPSCMKKLIMDSAECYMSIARGSVYGFLGYNLVYPLFDSREAISREIISIVYGGMAGIPVALLGSLASKQFIEDFVSLCERYSMNKKQLEKNIEKPLHSKIRETTLKLMFIGTPALLSSASITNLARVEFSPVIGDAWWIVGAPTLFIRFLLDYEKIPYVYGKIRNQKQIKPFVDRAMSYMGLSYERNDLEKKTREHLLQAREYIKSLESVDTECAEISNRNSTTEIKLSRLFSGRMAVRKDAIEEKLAGIGLATISLAGLWVFYPLTVEAFESLLDTFDLGSSETSIYYSNILATLALSSASAISAVAGYEVGTKLCKKALYGAKKEGIGETENCLSTQERVGKEKTKGISNILPYCIGISSLVLAACNASTSYSIYNEWPIENQAVAMTVLVAAVSSTFILSAWAVDSVLAKYINSKGHKKESLLHRIDIVTRKLPSLSYNHLQSLEKFLQSISEGENKRNIEYVTIHDLDASGDEKFIAAI